MDSFTKIINFIIELINLIKSYFGKDDDENNGEDK